MDQQVQNSDAANELDATLKEINETISTIVGLEAVKNQLKKWMKGLLISQRRKALGIRIGAPEALNMAFIGSPGTGKTMVARLLGKLLHKLGLIPTDKVIEVQRTDLVAQYIGDTGPKTREKIPEASGGILFIDEAYRLIHTDSYMDFGREALEEIMLAMDKGDVITIFADYTNEMNRVFTANAGFSRRLSKVFHFEDYIRKDIAMIMLSKFKAQEKESHLHGLKLHWKCTVEAIASMISRHIPEEDLKGMNGRLVDPWLVNALENLELRLDVKCSDVDVLTTITKEDLEEGLQSARSLFLPDTVWSYIDMLAIATVERERTCFDPLLHCNTSTKMPVKQPTVKNCNGEKHFVNSKKKKPLQNLSNQQKLEPQKQSQEVKSQEVKKLSWGLITSDLHLPLEKETS